LQKSKGKCSLAITLFEGINILKVSMCIFYLQPMQGTEPNLFSNSKYVNINTGSALFEEAHKLNLSVII